MPIVLTDDEYRRLEREYVVRNVNDGRHQCPGYPVDHYCLTLIPWSQRLCRFCDGTRAIEMARLVRGSASVPTVGEILQDIPIPDAPVEFCGCGGIKDADYHDQSLTHLEWYWQQPKRAAQFLRDVGSSRG